MRELVDREIVILNDIISRINKEQSRDCKFRSVINSFSEEEKIAFKNDKYYFKDKNMKSRQSTSYILDGHYFILSENGVNAEYLTADEMHIALEEIEDFALEGSNVESEVEFDDEQTI